MPNGIYLTANDNPTQIVRCPVHGFIRFSRNERRIIDHEVFQRLRRIRQLALTVLVYPGAVHTRFEHSFGVMDLAGRAFESVEFIAATDAKAIAQHATCSRTKSP